MWEMAVKRPAVQSHSLLQSKYQTNSGFVRACLKKNCKKILITECGSWTDLRGTHQAWPGNGILPRGTYVHLLQNWRLSSTRLWSLNKISQPSVMLATSATLSAYLDSNHICQEESVQLYCLSQKNKMRLHREKLGGHPL